MAYIPTSFAAIPGNATIGDQSSMPANATASNGTTSAAASAPNATLTEFVSNIEQIRGHLEQTVANKESGNNTLAQAHTMHPIEEIYSSVEGPIASQNSTLNQTLSQALQELSSSVSTASAQQVEDQTDSIDSLLDQTVVAVVPASEMNSTSFNASVVASLLDVAGHEYNEAVANGTIKAVVEYQDAQAFIYRAEAVFNATSDTIPQTMAHEVEEVNEFFTILNRAVNTKGDPATVETTVNGIIHELEEITGLSSGQLLGEEAGATQEQDPLAIIDNIKSMLGQLLTAYQSQNYQEAESIAIEAYLENYEYIEAPIAEHDEELMEQTEVMLREELRQMIADRVPAEEIQQHIAEINANLDEAASLLQQ
ncbi:MAG TPA: hypothetical protein VF172_09440 [Nitrososphaera sp.]